MASCQNGPLIISAGIDGGKYMSILYKPSSHSSGGSGMPSPHTAASFVTAGGGGLGGRGKLAHVPSNWHCHVCPAMIDAIGCASRHSVPNAVSMVRMHCWSQHVVRATEFGANALVAAKSDSDNIHLRPSPPPIHKKENAVNTAVSLRKMGLAVISSVHVMPAYCHCSDKS